MKITYLAHACFKVETKGCTIVLDPYKDGSVPGVRPMREEAALVLCSHEHGDHFGKEHVTLRECDALPVQVTKIATYHDDVKGAKRGKNTIHILEDGTTKLVHLGDLGCELEPDQMEQLRGADVMLVPVGGCFTIDGAQAAALVKELSPRMVIPMHYRLGCAGYDVISTVEPFVEAMGGGEILETAVIDTEEPQTAQVLVLHPQNA